MFQYLFRKFAKKFDGNKYFNYSVDEKEINVLQAPEYEEFRKALVSIMEKKVSENMNLLVHRDTSDKEAGIYIGAIRVYEDLIQWFTKVEAKPNKGYTDPYNQSKTVEL